MDESTRDRFNLKPSSVPSGFLARNTRSPHSLCRSHASLSPNVCQTPIDHVIARRPTARRTAYTRSPSTIRFAFLSSLLSRTLPCRAVCPEADDFIVDRDACHVFRKRQTLHFSLRQAGVPDQDSVLGSWQSELRQAAGGLQRSSGRQHGHEHDPPHPRGTAGSRWRRILLQTARLRR